MFIWKWTIKQQLRNILSSVSNGTSLPAVEVVLAQRYNNLSRVPARPGELDCRQRVLVNTDSSGMETPLQCVHATSKGVGTMPNRSVFLMAKSSDTSRLCQLEARPVCSSDGPIPNQLERSVEEWLSSFCPHRQVHSWSTRTEHHIVGDSTLMSTHFVSSSLGSVQKHECIDTEEPRLLQNL